MLVNTQNIHQSQALLPLTLPFTITTNAAKSEQNPISERRNQRRSPLWANPWIQNHADLGRRHSTLRKPRLSAVLARNTWVTCSKPREKWYENDEMIWNLCVFLSFWRFTFFNELKYLQKTLEMLDFHRKKAHGKAMISSSFVGYDLKSLIEGRRR